MFEFLIVQPITNILIFFYIIFGENLGYAIIFFILILRIALLPLTIRQLKIQKKLQDLQPKLQEIQAKRKTPDKFSPEEMILMREVSSSCLGLLIPFVIQIPILLGLYRVINEIASLNNDLNRGGDFFNNILYFDFLKHASDYRFNTQFLGLDLAIIPSKLELNVGFLPYLLLIALLVVSQYLQSAVFIARQKKQTKVNKKANQKKLSREEQERLELQESMNKLNNFQMLFIVPALVGLGAYSFFVALSVYWLTQNIFSLFQTFIQFGYLNDTKLYLKSFRNKLLIFWKNLSIRILRSQNK